jgi:hypothetical protein
MRCYGVKTRTTIQVGKTRHGAIGCPKGYKPSDQTGYRACKRNHTTLEFQDLGLRSIKPQS